MSLNTGDVERFARRVMREFNPPYPETITNDVFCKIENVPEFFQRYDELCKALKVEVVNPAIGKYVIMKTKLCAIGTGTAQGTTLITKYTRLGKCP